MVAVTSGCVCACACFLVHQVYMFFWDEVFSSQSKYLITY